MPIADLYVPPIFIRVVDSERGGRTPELDMARLADGIDRTVLLGDPGAGKTTASNVLMHRHAADPGRRVPFLVTLREFAAHQPPERSVAGHIEHRLETFYQCAAPPGLVARLLLSGSALVIFDGLDELVDMTRRAEVSTIVERFCTEYPLARVLVTSRLVGYDQARLDDRQFSRYRIGDFTDDQVAEYVGKWFALEQGASRSPEDFMEESADISDLRANPLMLALLCILYRGEGSLPRERAEVYKQCADLLFRKWDARRRIHLDVPASHLVEPALRHLAWWLFERGPGQAAVTERELVRETAEFLHERGFETIEEARDAAAVFIQFCRGRMWVFSDTGTTAAGDPLYSFTHRTFLEYFAAARLAATSDTPEKLARALAPHAARREWEIVGELAVQIKDHTIDQGAQRIYTTLLEERRRRSPEGRSGILEFMARTLRSVDPSPGTVRRLTEEILDHLFADDPDKPIHYRPLSVLLVSCTSARDLVADTIRTRVAAMIESADPAIHLNGVRLAAHLSADLGLGGDQAIHQYWSLQSAMLVTAHSNAVVAAAGHELAVLFTALDNHLIDIETILVPGRLDRLFELAPMRIFGVIYGSRLPNAIRRIAFGWPKQDIALTELAAFGRFLATNPRPPWVMSISSEDTFIVLHFSKEDVSIGPLSPAAYLGAAVTLLISVEISPPQVAPEGMDRLGSLLDVYPYILRRQKIGTNAELPELSVPENFQRIFQDWADGRIDFVASSRPSR